MLMLPRKRGDLLDFRGGNISWKDPTYTHAFPMDFEHDLGRLFAAQRKKCLQYRNDEIHRSVIVVQQQNFKQARGLNLAFLDLKERVIASACRHLPPLSSHIVMLILLITGEITSTNSLNPAIVGLPKTDSEPGFTYA